MDISALYTTMISLFFAIILGYSARKMKLVEQNFVDGLSKLLLFVFQPALTLGSVLNIEHLLSNGEVIALTGIVALCYVGLLLLALAVPFLFRQKEKSRANVYRYMMVFSNVGFMGYPLVESLYGPSALFYVTVFVLVFHLLVNSLGAYYMSGDKKHIGFTTELLKKPALLSAVLAFVIYLLDISVPTWIASPISYIGSTTTPLSMILIGCTLATVPIRQIFNVPSLYTLFATKLIVVPIATFAILSCFVQDPMILSIVTVIMATPVATNANMLAVVYGGDQQLASAGVFLSTTISMATIPLVMQLLFT